MKRLIILFEILVLVAATVLMQSCKDSSLNPYLDNKGGFSSLLDSGYYPNTAGSYWIYEIATTDSIPFIIDTVDVRLSKNEMQSDSSQFLTYNYYFHQLRDIYSASEVIKNDTINRFNNPNMQYNAFFIIPFEVGKIYIETITDTVYNSGRITTEIRVENYDSVTVKAGRFMAYKIVTTITYEMFGNSPSYEREVQYFVPYIGSVIIEDAFWDYNFRQYFSKNKWELIDYKIEKK